MVTDNLTQDGDAVRNETSADNKTQNLPSATKIALCLSGGGYRAALFHLGAMRCLHDLGILEQLTTVSSVSGGSILAAYIARRMHECKITGGMKFENWERDVSSGFRRFVLNDIRTIPFLFHVGWNWIFPKWRARHLQRNYSKKLLALSTGGNQFEMKLSDLPVHPYFIFCATDLTFGVNWIFTREEIGDYMVGYAKSKDTPVAEAVAASSCFPPIFGPMVLNLDADEFKNGSYRDKTKRASLLNHLNLTDGGVYDNLGIEPVDRGYQTVIISDGGSPFDYVRKNRYFGRLLRYNSVIMRQVAALRKKAFFSGITRKLYDGCYISVGSSGKPPQIPGVFNGYRNDDTRSRISSIRTDLDRFDEAESSILENHGYYEMYNRVVSKLGHLLPNPQPLPVTPHSSWLDESKVLKALENSSKRLSARRLWMSVWNKHVDSDR